MADVKSEVKSEIDGVEFRNFAFQLLKEFGKLTPDDIQRYFELRKGGKISEREINEILKADKRFRRIREGKTTYWTL